MVLLLGGCVTTPPDAVKDIRVSDSTHPKARLSGFRSYAWVAAAAVVNDPEDKWSPSNLDVGQEIMFLVDRELGKRGMAKVTADPDVLLIYAVGVDMESLDVVKTPESGVEELKNVPKAGVLVIMVDPPSGRVIWVGGASGDIRDQPTVELTKERLNFGITEMFKRFGDTA